MGWIRNGARLRLGLFALTALLVPPVAGATAETVLRLNNWLPTAHLIVQDILLPWAEAVRKATEGRLRIEILAAPLGKPPASFDIARDGLADISYGPHGYTPGRFHLTQIAELPFLGDTAAALSVAYWRVHEAHFAVKNEHKGVHLLGLWTHGPGQIFNARRPVTEIDDLAGLKFRVGGGLVSKISDALGTVAVASPSTKAYELLSNGVADGIYFPLESVSFFNLVDLLPFGTLVPGGLYNTTFFLIMNGDRWDSLDPADRAAIDAVSGAALAPTAGAAWDAADARARAVLDTAITVTPANDALQRALRDRLAFLETAWLEKAAARGVDGTAALALLRAEVAAATAD